MVLKIQGIKGNMFDNAKAVEEGIAELKEETYPREDYSDSSTSGAFDGINNTNYAQLTGMETNLEVTKRGYYLIIFDCELVYLSETILNVNGCDIGIFVNDVEQRSKKQNIFLEDSGDGDECATYGSSSIHSRWDFSIHKIVLLEEGDTKIDIKGKRNSNTRYGTENRELSVIKLRSL